MSKGNSAIKVLRTGLGRVQKGWTQGTWMTRDPETGKVYVCLEGAIYGYCKPNMKNLTPAQIEAGELIKQILNERYPRYSGAIPSFNDDPGRTQEEVEEVIKLAIIREETGGLDPEASDEEDFDDLLEFMDSKG